MITSPIRYSDDSQAHFVMQTRVLRCLVCVCVCLKFAEAVTATTPTEGRVKGLDLEGLLNTLQRDPFSTRKQLPRTPESLSKL